MKQNIFYLFFLLVPFCIKAQVHLTLDNARSTGGSETACQSITLKPGFRFTAASGNSLTLQVNPSTCNPYAGTTDNITSSQNYIRSRTYTNSESTLYLDQIAYFDGLGRPMQSIQRGITPEGNDLVTYQEYDVVGREYRSWLPTVASGNNGAYIPLAGFETKAMGTYNNTTYHPVADSVPYSKLEYDSSPLSRIMNQYGPGMAWQKSGMKVFTQYWSNTTSGWLSCTKYISTNDTKVVNIIHSGIYAANELFIANVTNENGDITLEFKNKQGQVILTRQMDGSIQYDTYYIYDSSGNLRAVLPPEAADRFTSGTWTETTQTLKDYAFVYKYDGRKRCIAKKLPGCEWIYFIYDKADRMIFTQDGEMRIKNIWYFSIPDGLGRISLTGTCNNTFTYTSDPLINVTVKASWAKVTNSYKGYTISGITLTTPVILGVNYYDNDEFIGLNSVPSDLAYVTESGYGVKHGNSKGMLTGTINALLDNPSSYIYSSISYDNQGRIIQTRSTNHLTGGRDLEYFTYNFTGQPTAKKHIHSATGKTAQTEVYKYTYDHAGRSLATTHQLNGGTIATVSANTYDELGRLKTNKKNNLATLTSTYSYNIRSWVKSITGSLFSQTLYYNESYGGSAKQYNGNISAMSWLVSGDKTRGYAFAYDKLSRLTTANYLENAIANTNYKVTYAYDKHGNIKKLQRYGKTTASAYGVVDSLTMNYQGNQLVKTEDPIATISLTESADFKNYARSATEYTYNKNGAMESDLNKGILKINYNSLNLPHELAVKNPSAVGKTYYTYSSGGKKLKTVHKTTTNMTYTPVMGSTNDGTNYNMTKTTDYIGNIIYENGTLKRILVDGGYIEGGIYHFYLNDHLGNNRVVANSNGTIIQKNHYYPFGMAFAENTKTEQSKQPYKYGTKELDDTHGLNIYDFEARYSDPTLANRFWMVDPLAEIYYSTSPYAYVKNNPFKYIDPTGMKIKHITSTFVSPDGTILDSRNDGDYAIYLVHDPEKWNKTKDDLLIIGYTPKPDTFRKYIGRNLKTEPVINFWFSEIEKYKKTNLFMSWRALQHLDKLATLKKNSITYKENLKIYYALIKELMLSNITMQSNNEKLLAIEKSKKQRLSIAGARVMINTLLYYYPIVSLPGSQVIDELIPFNIEELDRQLQGNINSIDKKYEEYFKNIIGEP